jgi:hypothetical protein
LSFSLFLKKCHPCFHHCCRDVIFVVIIAVILDVSNVLVGVVVVIIDAFEAAFIVVVVVFVGF